MRIRTGERIRSQKGGGALRNEYAGNLESAPAAELTFVELMSLTCDDIREKVVLCGCRFDEVTGFDEMRAVLYAEERDYFDSLKFVRRKTSFLLGRYSAKKALAAYLGEQDLHRILIKPGIFNHPVVLYPYRESVQVTITHCDCLGAAIAYPETFPMGIDIERSDIGKVTILEKQITAREKEKLAFLPLSYEKGLTFLWTAKEALSKIMRTGLTAPFHFFELGDMIYSPGGHIAGFFRNFPQYKVRSFCFGDYVFTVAFPKNAELSFGPDTVRRLIRLTKTGHLTAV